MAHKNGTRYPGLVFLIISLVSFSINSSSAQTTSAQNTALSKFLNNEDLKTAHVGVYVYDDSSKKVIADYQSDKYFVPASNVKLFTLYAGMKFLGDSIVGIRYIESDTALRIFPTGDPSFLHPDFQSQPVFDFLKKTKKKIYIEDMGWDETPLGPGWAWDDYNEAFSAERSPFPIYGNFIRWNQQNSPTRSNPAFEPTTTVSSSPEISWNVRFSKDSSAKTFFVERLIDSNVFVIRQGNEPDISQEVPFKTNNINAVVELLPDTIGKPVYVYKHSPLPVDTIPGWHSSDYPHPPNLINSRPVDSLFMPMMYRSDNFFAEQTLIMVGHERFGLTRQEAVTDLLLRIIFGPLSVNFQSPKWVDGSGLSHYNLFTPQDFVSVLIKMKNEFGMDRMKRILPTGGKGTLKNYYHADSGRVFAKTGSMNGVLCLSGYIYTAKKHLLEFSILINNNTGNSSAMRREIENYVESLIRNN